MPVCCVCGYTHVHVHTQKHDQNDTLKTFHTVLKINSSHPLVQVIFEAEVSDGKAGFIAVDDIQVLSYPCGESAALTTLPHLRRKSATSTLQSIS